MRHGPRLVFETNGQWQRLRDLLISVGRVSPQLEESVNVLAQGLLRHEVYKLALQEWLEILLRGEI